MIVNHFMVQPTEHHIGQALGHQSSLRFVVVAVTVVTIVQFLGV